MGAQISKNIKYFNISETDQTWGLVVTTVGCQRIPVDSCYPLSQHPKTHAFDTKKGRVLKEYQMIYISEGKGTFKSASCGRCEIEAGSMILLFPNEWHTYEPNRESGWVEYWVGFRGDFMDARVQSGFFQRSNPVLSHGFSPTIIGLFDDIATHAVRERSSYQQFISSVVIHALGLIYYQNRNASFPDSMEVNKINEAKNIMKQQIDENIAPKDIALRLGVSYSWFRKAFKQYVDVSPAQYQANLRFLRSKELLDTTDLCVVEIAYKLNFGSVTYFSTFFKSKEGSSPVQYRKGGFLAES